MLPRILSIHLKRFKYDKNCRMQKLNWKIAYPFEMKVKDFEGKEVLYRLFSVIVHIGPGFQYGHYVSIIKCQAK